MSKTGVLIWLVIALVLGAGAIFLLQKKPLAAPAPGPLMDIPLARIAELAVTQPGRPADRVTRDAATGDWSLITPDGDWPVQIGNIQTALRLLSTLEGRDADASAKPPGPGDAEVRLILDNGDTWTIWLADRSLGGERLARIQPPGSAPGRTAMVDARLFDALVKTGPTAWRLPLALTDLTAELDRITLTALNGRIVLGKANGRWALHEPVAAPADDKAVDSLLKSLASVHVARFLDGPAPDPASTHLEAPIAIAALESERRQPRDGGFDTLTQTRTLTVGGPASIDGSDLYARVDRAPANAGQPGPAGSSTLITISRESVEAISMDAATYLAPAAVATPPGEVGVVEIIPAPAPVPGAPTAPARRLARTIDGWQSGTDAANLADTAQVASLLKLLCEQEAERKILNATPPAPLATIRLSSLGDSPLGEVSIGVSSTLGQPDGQEGPAKVFINSGGVIRLYEPAPWTDLIDWIAAPAPR